jgi:hypothetical protein
MTYAEPVSHRPRPAVAVRRRAVVAVVLRLLVALGAGAPAAMAGNTGRCRPAFKVGTQYRNHCSLWRGHVPVYSQPWDNSPGSQDSAQLRGEPVYGGYANWFWGQVRSLTYSYGAYYNDRRASTMPDNGQCA